MNKQRKFRRRRSNWRQRGVVLVMVLIVVAVLTLSAYAFSELMLSHSESARYSGLQTQSRALVDSGVDSIRMFLAQDEMTRLEAGGIYDNPGQFMAIPVLTADDFESSGAFTVISPAIDDDGYLVGMRYGLEDESTRLNLNALIAADKAKEGAGQELLMALPGMTEDVADAILDWLDSDTEIREFGAEAPDYEGLNPPYVPKDGPLDTIEELLLVHGVTPELLFGADMNRNGMIDASEQELAGAVTMYTDPETGAGLDRGWSGYLTLHSQEKNANAQGLPRINLNGEDLEALYDELSAVFDESWAKFIILYRQYGAAEGNNNGGGGEGGGGEGGGGEGGGGEGRGGEGRGGGGGEEEEELEITPLSDVELDFEVEARTNISQVLDLIGARVQIQVEGEEEPLIVESPFADDPIAAALYMPILVDEVTVVASRVIPGRININEASYVMLVGIPGMDEELASIIIEMRAGGTEEEGTNRDHETWLYTEGLVTLDEMKALSPFVCAGGDVYRAQVVGYFMDGSSSARGEVIIDATHTVPRVLFWRDMSHLGRGYPLQVLGGAAAAPF